MRWDIKRIGIHSINHSLQWAFFCVMNGKWLKCWTEKRDIINIFCFPVSMAKFHILPSLGLPDHKNQCHFSRHLYHCRLCSPLPTKCYYNRSIAVSEMMDAVRCSMYMPVFIVVSALFANSTFAHRMKSRNGMRITNNVYQFPCEKCNFEKRDARVAHTAQCPDKCTYEYTQYVLEYTHLTIKKQYWIAANVRLFQAHHFPVWMPHAALTHTHAYTCTMIKSNNTLKRYKSAFLTVCSTGSILFYFISLLRFKFNSFIHIHIYYADFSPTHTHSRSHSWNSVAVVTCYYYHLCTTTTTKH